VKLDHHFFGNADQFDFCNRTNQRFPPTLGITEGTNAPLSVIEFII